MDAKTRKLLNFHGMHHPNADIYHLYVPKSEELVQLDMSYKTTILALQGYLKTIEDWMKVLSKNTKYTSNLIE